MHAQYEQKKDGHAATARLSDYTEQPDSKDEKQQQKKEEKRMHDMEEHVRDRDHPPTPSATPIAFSRTK